MARSTDDYQRQILSAIATSDRVTQRSLARELGVAVGLTNLLVRRLVAKGYVRMAGLGTRHVRYFMTATGWEALARVTRQSLENTVHLYTETRELIRQSLDSVSAVCPANDGEKRVVFYGAGDVAEIAYVSLQRTDLRLVGVVDDVRQGEFFGMPIQLPAALTHSTLAGTPYGHVVVTSVRHARAIQVRLDALEVPRSRVTCL